MDYLLRRLVTVFSHHLGALLMAFGALLVIVGLAVRLAREHQVTRAESVLGAPSFEGLLVPVTTDARGLTTAATSVLGVTVGLAGPTSTPPSLRLVDAPPFEAELLPTPYLGATSWASGRVDSSDRATGRAGSQTTRRRAAAAVQERSSYSTASIQTPEGIAVTLDPPAATVTPDPFVGADELPIRLVIPGIALDTAVVAVGWEARVVNGEFRGNEWQTADGAAGYHRNSALPGEVGNTVISGHNNIEGAVFKDLHRLKLGDRISVYTRTRRLDYVVAANFIVEEAGVSIEQRRANAMWIGPTPDVRLTLITCFPPWGNSHRTIVIAVPAPTAAAAAE